MAVQIEYLRTYIHTYIRTCIVAYMHTCIPAYMQAFVKYSNLHKRPRSSEAQSSEVSAKL